MALNRERSKTTNSAFFPSASSNKQPPPSSPSRSLIFKKSTPTATSGNHNSNKNEKVVVPKSFTIDVKQITTARNKLKNVNAGPSSEEMPASITIEAPEKKGLLRMTTEKEGGGGDPGGWDQRWCVLKEGRLYLFATAKALLPEKTLSLQGSIVREKKDAGVENCFSINTLDGESILFCTGPEEDFDYLTWIVGLRAATLYIRMSSFVVIEAPSQVATVTPSQPLSIPPIAHSLSVSQSPASSPSSSPSISSTPSPSTSNSSSPSNTPPLVPKRGLKKVPSQSSLPSPPGAPPSSSSAEPTITFSPSSPVLPKKGDRLDKAKKDYNFLSKSADAAPSHLSPTPSHNIAIGAYSPKFTQPAKSSPLTRPPVVDDLKSSTGSNKSSRKGQLAVPEGRVLFGTRWKPRWVVLANDSLSVYSSEGDEDKKEPMHSFEVIFCQAKVVKSEKERKYIFEIVGPTQSIQFGAVSSVELLEWIHAIQETQTILMQSYLQYNMGSISTNAAKSKTTDDYESQVSMELEKSKKMLQSVLKIPGNDVCADCGGPEPIWASINIGVFICIVCSGVHRQMGTHISKVRSLTMDKWECDTIEFMEANGNVRVNARLERSIRPPHSKLVPTASQQDRETFIRCKYEGKVFAGPPIT